MIGVDTVRHLVIMFFLIYTFDFLQSIALQMLLPGTINLDSFNAISTDSVPDLFNETLKNMTTLRALAVPIYMNGNYKRCDCEEGTTKEINYAIGQPMAETIQLERYYNR